MEKRNSKGMKRLKRQMIYRFDTINRQKQLNV